MTAPSPAPTQDPLGLHESHAYRVGVTTANDLPEAPPALSPIYSDQSGRVVEPPQQAATAALTQQAIDRKAVAAQGVDITLRDGRVLDMRYGMAGVVALEETFGSLKGVAEAFAILGTGEGAAFTAILGLVGAGLVHHGITRADLLRHDLLELTRLMEYADAAGAAFDRAFPAPASAGEGEGQTTG